MQISSIKYQTQYNTYNKLNFGQWVKIPPMSEEEIRDTYKKLYPEYSKEDLLKADERGNLPIHRESLDDRVKMVCDMLKDEPDKLKQMLLWKNNKQETPAHYCSASKLKILCDALKDDKQSLEDLLLAKDKAGRIPVASIINKGVIDVTFNALKDNPVAIKKILAFVSELHNSPLFSFLCAEDVLLLTNKYVELGEFDLLKKQLLTKYHNINDPFKLNEGDTPIHNMNSIGLKRILNIYKGNEKVLAELLLTKNDFDEMPLFTQRGEGVKLILETVKNNPAILSKMFNNISKNGFSVMYRADASKTQTIINSLKDKPEILIPAILLRSQKNDYDNCLYGAGPQKIRVIFNYLKDYPSEMVKLLSERNINNKLPSELADIQELPIILEAIYELATNYKQYKIPYTTALCLLNENTEAAERYDKATGSNFAKKFKQTFCIDVEEIKHPSEFLEDYSS